MFWSPDIGYRAAVFQLCKIFVFNQSNTVVLIAKWKIWDLIPGLIWVSFLAQKYDPYILRVILIHALCVVTDPVSRDVHLFCFWSETPMTSHRFNQSVAMGHVREFVAKRYI